MKILALADVYPMFDRNGAELRFLSILKGMAREGSVSFCALQLASKTREVGDEAVRRYRLRLQEAGVRVLDEPAAKILKGDAYDAVYFPYFTTAAPWVESVRIYQPEARLIVDNGDIHFRRMRSKALLTGDPRDMEIAERDKREELSVYARGDVVIVVSPEDEATLREELPAQPSFLIPNIHALPAASAAVARERDTLVFVGAYTHPPNVDAARYFVNEVLPLVVAARPAVRLRLIGFAPPPEVLALASEQVEVVGYVPETAPYLDSSWVSVAPIRFGAGVKGKIGDALAHRLPVVSTSVGVEGFGLTPGVDILVADTPSGFAEAVLRLLDDDALHASLAEAGYAFIRDHFSEEVIGRGIAEFLSKLDTYAVKRLSPAARYRRLGRDWLERTVLWRFR